MKAEIIRSRYYSLSAVTSTFTSDLTGADNLTWSLQSLHAIRSRDIRHYYNYEIMRFAAYYIIFAFSIMINENCIVTMR